MSIAAQPLAIQPRASRFAAALFLLVPIVTIAQSAAPAPAPAPPQISPKQDYMIPKDGDVATPYCDRALPYKYLPARTSVQLAVNAQNDQWLEYLAKNYAKLEGPKSTFAPFTKESVAPPASTPPPQTPTTTTPDTADFDPRKDTGNWLYDNGGPLLTPAPPKTLASTTPTAPRAERLLVRTLFGPDPFTAPCSYNYLTSAMPPADNSPIYSPSGQQENPVTPGAMGPYHFSFLDPAAPEFYLVNITQWSHPPSAPTGAAAPPSTYNQATDTWLLLNFKHPEKSQDLTKLIFRAGLTPQIVADTVPELMGKRVIVLGIQLAPTVPVPNSVYLKSLPAGITPTEQAWFKDVKVRYKLHADSVTSLESQDLSTLIQAVIAASGVSNYLPAAANSAAPGAGSNTSAATTAGAAGGAAPAPPASAGQQAPPPEMSPIPSPPLAPTESFEQAISGSASLSPSALAAIDPIGADLTEIQTLLVDVNDDAATIAGINLKAAKQQKLLDFSPLMLYLYGATPVDIPRDYGAKCSQYGVPLLTYTQASESAGTSTDYLNQALSSKVEDCIKGISRDPSLDDSSRSAAESAAIADLQLDITALNGIKSLLDKDIQNYKPYSTAKPAPAPVSLFQGVYVASLVSNIQDLPLNITPSWSAAFPAVPQANPAVTPGPGATPVSGTSTPAATGTPVTVNPKLAPPGPAQPAHGPAPTADDHLYPAEDLLPELPSPLQQKASTQTTAASGSKPTKTPTAAPAANPVAKSQSTDPSTPVAPATPAPTQVCSATLAADKASQAPCTATDGTPILDELFAHFDFTAAVSVTGYKDLTIPSASTTGSSVATTATVTRENAYGIVDFFFVREDLANPPVLGIPHFAVGIPFAGQVLDKPYFAVGETINIPQLLGKNSKLANVPVLNILTSSQFPLQIHPVFGYVWNKESSATNGVITKYRDFRPQWAIEIPFRNFAKLISSFTKSSSSSSSK